MSTDIVSFDILINGNSISGSIDVISIEVEQNNTKNVARIETEVSSDTYPIPVNNNFDLGASIEIQLGYDGKKDTAFEGKISDKGVRVSQGVGARNIFICESDTSANGTGKSAINSDDVYNIDLGCDDTNNIEGGIELQGTLEYGLGTNVSLGDIVAGFPVTPIYSITHEVSEGNWFTSLHFIKLGVEETKIELSTKGGNRIVLDDENNSITIQDANDNSIVFSDSGIDIKSPNDINSSASKSILIKGDMGITNHASGGDVSINGLNTKITADMQASMQGSMSAEVEGGTELTLKGAMVMIN